VWQQGLQAIGDFSLVVTMTIASRAHNDLAAPVKFDLERQVLQAFILAQFNPVHALSLIFLSLQGKRLGAAAESPPSHLLA
jgi:hypothetical protein